jgi:hypothetical protein
MTHTHHGHHSGHGGRTRFIGAPWDLNTTINPWFQTMINGKCYWCNSFTGECIPCATPQHVAYYPPLVDCIKRGNEFVGIYQGDLPPFNRQLVGQESDPNSLIPTSFHVPSPIANKGDVVREKEFLQKYVTSTDVAVARNTTIIPAQLVAHWVAWRTDWSVFYLDNPIYLLPGQPGNDLDRVKKYEAEFADIQNELAKYTDVSPMINPVNSPSAPTPGGGLFGGVNQTVDKGIDLVKWGLIGGVVIIAALALVASSNIKSGGQVAGKLL